MVYLKSDPRIYSPYAFSESKLHLRPTIVPCFIVEKNGFSISFLCFFSIEYKSTTSLHLGKPFFPTPAPAFS